MNSHHDAVGEPGIGWVSSQLQLAGVFLRLSPAPMSSETAIKAFREDSQARSKFYFQGQGHWLKSGQSHVLDYWLCR